MVSPGLPSPPARPLQYTRQLIGQGQIPAPGRQSRLVLIRIADDWSKYRTGRLRRTSKGPRSSADGEDRPSRLPSSLLPLMKETHPTLLAPSSFLPFHAPSLVLVLSGRRAATITDSVGTAACGLKPRWSLDDMAADDVGVAAVAAV